MSDIKQVPLRIPTILFQRVSGDVKARQVGDPKLSLNAWLVEAVREKLDGPPMSDIGQPAAAVATSGQPPQDSRRKTAAEIAASIPGVSLGIPDATEQPRLLDVTSWPEEPAAADDWEARYSKDFGMKRHVMAKQAFPAYRKLGTWEDRHRWMTERQESEVGT